MTAKFVDKMGNEGLVSPFDDPELIRYLQQHGVKLDLQAFNPLSPQNLENFVAIVVFWIVLGGFFGIGYLYGGIGNPFSYLKSNSKFQMEPKTGVKFEDVAGVTEAKEELKELVEFLK